ncbi:MULTISPECIES: sensor histidine kinase [Actinosynnema]|uniref:sensor histidine kinase n=1 Tax=Actinosynnema TaxID=40566 RepID=UPI0020A24E7A|nr:sensor histidine kinase [Actinosynnema pretiosum]MCP2095558.1 Signal transduction histidine kinase [Actinosynnema pretiosum]
MLTSRSSLPAPLAAAALVLLVDTGPHPWSEPLALLACALLPFRRAAPYACLPALVGGLGWPPAVVALYRVGRHDRAPVAALWVVASAAVAATTFVVTQSLPFTQAVLTYAFTLFMAVMPAALGVLLRTRQELTRTLSEARRARTAELVALEEGARAAERARIAREIHDVVGHHATLIAVEAAALSATTPDPEARAAATRLRALAKESLEEMRSTLGLLKSQPPPNTHHDLPALVERARSTGLPITLTDRTTTPLPPSTSRAVYRLVQESLTNATKHAPNAQVHILLATRADTLVVQVRNAPPPHPPPHPRATGGQGLHGLSERVALLGGTLSAAPTPQGGFEVRATLPTTATRVGGERRATVGPETV